MPDLFDNKTKQDQKTLSVEKQKQQQKSAIPSAADKTMESTKVVGRQGLDMPVPKEAMEKSVTGAVKTFFGLKRSEMPRPGDDIIPNPNPQPQPQANAVVQAPARIPLVDLTDEERLGVSENLKKEHWENIAAWTDGVMNSPEFANTTDLNKTQIRELDRLAKCGKDDERYVGISRLMKDIKDKNADLLAEIKTLNDWEWADENEKLEQYQAIINKYPGADLCLNLLSQLQNVVYGNLDIPEGAKIIDQSDDAFFSTQNTLMKRTIPGPNGVVYTHQKVECDQNANWSHTPLFTTEPSIADVRQGMIGDCGFLSAINAVLETDPQYIKNCMKDEGATVLVRLYSAVNNEPIYVRVRKSYAKVTFSGTDANGNPVQSVPQTFGAKGGIWVHILEKALSVVRRKVGKQLPADLKKPLFGTGAQGFDLAAHVFPDEAFQWITGKKSIMKTLPIADKNRKFTKIDTLFSQAHYGEKEDFMRGRNADGSKRTARDWNRFKAEKIFGLNIPEGNNDLVDVFKSQRVFKAYQNYIKNYLKARYDFKSADRDVAFRTMTDLNIALDSIDPSQMPTLNIGHGVDELGMKRSYIEYFRKSVASSGLLKNGINIEGKYSEEEKEIWRHLNAGLVDENGNKRAVTAATLYQDMTNKSATADTGASGEIVMAGVAGTHAYTITGTTIKEVEIGGRRIKQRFVIIRNPWYNSTIRLYDRNTMRPYTNTADKKSDGTDYQVKGAFLMEFSDFCESFGFYSVTEDTKSDTAESERKIGSMREVEFKPVVDLNAQEREGKSDRAGFSKLEDLANRVAQIKAAPGYEDYPDDTKIILEKIALLAEKSLTPRTRSQLEAEIMPVLKAVAEQNEGPAVLKEFADILVPMSRGGLELTGTETVVDGTDDQIFVSSEDLKEEVKPGDGVVLKHWETYFDLSSDMTSQPLFATEPSLDDVKQGNVGDCYLLSGLNSILEQDPSYVRNAMKDEGSTVVVRFYHFKTNQPIFVRVKKTVAIAKFTGVDKKGKPYSVDRIRGARGALWVNIMEKAYAVVRQQVGDPAYKNQEGAFNRLSSGKSHVFIKTLTGKQFKLRTLFGHKDEEREYRSFGELSKYVHYNEKNEFRNRKNADGSDRTAKDWNIYKAKKIFGVDIPSRDTALYDLFRKNTIFDAYEKYMKNYLKEYFESSFKDDKNKPAFSTTFDLNMFLDSIDISKMPVFKLRSGIDEDDLKRNYIEYFRSSIIASGLLKNNVCTDGQYSTKEMEVYNLLREAGNNNKMVVASANALPLMKNKKYAAKAANGEKTEAGMGFGHAYSIHGTVSKEIRVGDRTVTQLFVKVINPWRDETIRHYDKDTLRPFANQTEKYEDGTDYDAKGTFLMELRDFCETFGTYRIEKDDPAPANP